MRIGEAYVFIKILWPADKTVWSPPGLPRLRGRGLARGVGRVFASRRGETGVFRAANRYTVSLQGVRGGVAPPHGGVAGGCLPCTVFRRLKSGSSGLRPVDGLRRPVIRLREVDCWSKARARPRPPGAKVSGPGNDGPWRSESQRARGPERQ